MALEHEVTRQEPPVMSGPMQAGAADALARREGAPAPHRQRALVWEMAEGDGLDRVVGNELGAASVTQFVTDRRQHEVIARHAVGSALETDHGEAGLGQFAGEDRAGPAHPDHDRIDFLQTRHHDWLPFAATRARSDYLCSSLRAPRSSPLARRLRADER